MIAVAALALAAIAAQAPAAPCRAGWLGVEATSITSNVRKTHDFAEYVAGALVREVQAGSPAARAGIAASDVIQSVGRTLVQNACDFQGAIEKIGCEEVHIVVRRGASTRGLDVRLAAAPMATKKRDEEQACRDGDGSACTSLATKRQDAPDLLRRACDLGDGEGCYELALKAGNDQDAAAAYEDACDAGSTQACTNLGWMYENGHGVAVDLNAAARLFERGCDGNACGGRNNLGCVNLGRLYRDGIGVTENQIHATRLFREVCERGPNPGDREDAENVARACSLYGTACLSGKGVTRDVSLAVTMLQKGCEVGDTFGCFNLGVIYANGEVVKQNKARAAMFYKLACDHGDTEACQSLAAIKK